MRSTEIGTDDFPEYKKVSRDAMLGIYEESFKKNPYDVEPYRKTSEVCHNQLKIINKKVSGMSGTLEKDLYEGFAMRISDNMIILEKLDEELKHYETTQGIVSPQLMAYASVVQIELRGMLDSLSLL